MKGRIHLVGTPIGNLGDLTLRAIDVLRAVEHVAAEDTRRTRALLSHLQIQGKRLHALDAHASGSNVERLLLLVEQGAELALVTDAGMPGVSDPGRALVRAAAERGLPVVVVPGPSAVTAAVALSGLVEAAFFFAGFLPRRGKKREAALARLATTVEPVLLFEAPLRVAGTLSDLAVLMPGRAACVCRELTKLHEEALRGTLSDLAAPAREWRGECVIVLGASEAAAANSALSEADLGALLAARIAGGEPVKRIAAELAQLTGLPRRELYARVLAAKARRDLR